MIRKTDPTEQEFLQDVSEHQISVIRDDGLLRHVRFKRQGTYNHYFDLITWPGCLCYTGDMGTYVFQRIEDMFEFFRTDRQPKEGQTLFINLDYWSKKLIATDRVGVKEFSEERFNRIVVDDLVRWIRENAYRTTKEERRTLWETVMNEVIGADGDSGGYRKQIAGHDFYHHVNKRVGDFCLQDFFEHTFDDYTYRFVWCCYAIAWGIQQYDTHTAPKERAAA
jgi:hypothetical protein